MEPEKRYSDAVVIGLVVAALVLGIALYNVVPLPKSKASSTDTALVPTTTTTVAAAPAPASSGSSSSVGAGSGTSGGLFGSAAPALQSGATAANGGPSVDVPEPPPVPAPTCPT